ncbi:hypothetical protein [Leifsonia sp. NPDC058248]|uniref:hypothetical protein n=1 Tax=Leifsonia sp. NPDC058248 TaxID=3346402 RepID=UPI0036DC8086
MPSLAPLAAPSDVGVLLGRDLSAAEEATALALLVSASAKARNYMRQDITAVADDVITLAGNWGPRIVLPQRPVTAVTSVTVNGTLLKPDAYHWDRFGNVDVLSGAAMPDSSTGSTGKMSNLWGPAGSTHMTYSSGPSWSGPASAVVITYDHGFDTVPAEIADEVAGMVAAQMSVPIGVMNEQIGGYKVAYVRSPGGSMTVTEAAKDVFNRYRKRVASTSVATSR